MEEGEIDSRINEESFEGEYRVAAHAINFTTNSLINDILTIIGYLTDFQNGNFNIKVATLPKKKAIITEGINSLKSNLNSVSTDVNKLIEAAIIGKLDMRVNTSEYKGDWNKLTEGLNRLLLTVSQPIDEANQILSKVSKGDFDITVSKGYKGSFGFMMTSLAEMIDSISSYINEITNILGEMAHGDLRRSISREYLGQFNLIKDSINLIANTLRSTIGEIKSSADNVFSGAKQISGTSMELATGASMQATSLETLNASIITINEKTYKTANEAKTANEFSIKSMDSAKAGNDEMTKMLKSMNEISEASRNISKIIKVIDDIAFQTNLLSLNAAVEAARAGEQGKSFAVVAEEVRSLAGRSKQAAQDTSKLIEDIIYKINEGTSTAQHTADSLHRIVSDTNSVSEIISNIFAATKEQTEGISQITTGINDISQVVQSNSSTSEEAAAAAQELNSQSEVLAQMVSKFII